MLYPFFKTLLLRPRLLATHVGNYLDLLRSETRVSVRQCTITAVAWLVCAGAFLLSLSMVGMAVMLGVMLNSFHWALAVVPAVPFLIAVVAAAVACRKVNYSPLQEIKQQLAADLEVFDTAGGRRERR